MEDRALCIRFFKSFKVVVRHALSVNAHVYMELPRYCGYWKYPSVERFLKQHAFDTCVLDGCQYGLTTLGGTQLIRKPWRIACKNTCLHTVLCSACDRSHQHAVCKSRDLTATQMYTQEIADIAHQCMVQCAAKGQYASAYMCCTSTHNGTHAATLATQATARSCPFQFACASFATMPSPPCSSAPRTSSASTISPAAFSAARGAEWAGTGGFPTAPYPPEDSPFWGDCATNASTFADNERH